MTLKVFCVLSFALCIMILACGLIIEAEIQYRHRKTRQMRELRAENALLKAEVRKQAFGTSWEIDRVKTELAVKELLLKQKWAGVQK